MTRSQEAWGGAELAEAIDSADSAAAAMKDCGRKDEAARLLEAVEAAKAMRFSIGVVGRTKRGKSTLINALLGRSDDVLAPVEKAPATNVISCFASGDREEAWVVFSHEGEPRKADSIPLSSIKSYACEDGNPDNIKGVARIEVVSPFPKLPRNVILVDTPGTHNTLSPVHGEVLLHYLPRLDAVIFLVSADEPIIEAELDLLSRIRDCDINKIFFAVNKSDRVDPDELAEGVAHNRSILAGVGLNPAEMFPIAAKTYWQSGTEPGVEQLLAAIHRLVEDEKGKTIALKLIAQTARLSSSVHAACTAELAVCERSERELRQEIDEISLTQKQLNDSRPARERRFRRQWLEAISVCEDSLPRVRSEVTAECRKIVENANALQLPSIGRTIHTTIIKKLDDALQPHFERLRSDVEVATKDLEVDFGMAFCTPMDAEGAVGTPTTSTARFVSVTSAGIVPALLAAGCTQLPGMVATAFLSAAPTVVTATLFNPFSWFAALGTGMAASGTAVAGGTAALMLTPVAAIGVPALAVFAGYKMATTWAANSSQHRAELVLGVRDRVEAQIAEFKAYLSRLKGKGDDVLVQFDETQQQQMDGHRARLEECIAQRPSPAQIEHLRRSVTRLSTPPSNRDADSSTSREVFF